MFGCVVSSRPVQTELQTISPTQFAFNLPAQPPFNHIAVFLLPGQTLPITHAAAVYVQLPSTQDFRLLGALGAQKPSAIFKINGNSSSAANAGAGAGQAGGGDDAMVDDATLQPPANATGVGAGANVVIGISVEPIQNVEQQLAQMKATAGNSNTNGGASSATGMELVRHQPAVGAASAGGSQVPPKLLAQRIIKNAFNFLSGFAIRSGGEDVVPMKRFQEWWNKFEKRVEMDPSFLEKDDSN